MCASSPLLCCWEEVRGPPNPHILFFLFFLYPIFFSVGRVCVCARVCACLYLLGRPAPERPCVCACVCV